MLRKRLKLTQAMLAEKVGVSIRTVQGWELGRGQRAKYIAKIRALSSQ